jgi:Fe-S-cluster containining protein
MGFTSCRTRRTAPGTSSGYPSRYSGPCRAAISPHRLPPLRPIVGGTCRVYLHRPVACRTYGFYVQRDKGLYCNDIEAQVASGALSDVVWGNQDAIDQRLKCTGETRELTLWFADWKAIPMLHYDDQTMTGNE